MWSPLPVTPALLRSPLWLTSGSSALLDSATVTALLSSPRPLGIPEVRVSPGHTSGFLQHGTLAIGYSGFIFLVIKVILAHSLENKNLETIESCDGENTRHP